MAPTSETTTRVSGKDARVIARGQGNWRNATTRRIKPDAAGIEVEGVDAKGNLDVRLSPGFEIALAAVVNANESSPDAQVAMIAAARTFAGNRGSKRVWDIDLAAAIGFGWTPEGAAEFRTAFGIPSKNRTVWPSRISETPYEDTPRGPVVDPKTGKLV